MGLYVFSSYRIVSFEVKGLLMGNTHGIADMAKELQATTADLLPACIISTSWPSVPIPPSLTLSAFATQGYVRDGVDLVYVDQEAHAVTLTGADGIYWLALSQDTFTAIAQWSREPGTCYLVRPSATRPPDVSGLLVFASLTVAGGAITAVTPAAGVTRAEALRALAGLGTMATQDASAVAITGGTVAAASVQGATVTATGLLTGYADARINGHLGLNTAPHALFPFDFRWQKVVAHGLAMQPLDADSGNANMIFFNNAGGAVGTIYTNATVTAYNTSSDVRLKFNIKALTGSLDLIRRLNPVSHLWNADGSYGEGFLAHELMQEVPLAVSGLPDEVNLDGSIKPQQVDNSKLIPRLTAAIKDLLARVEALEAQLSP